MGLTYEHVKYHDKGEPDLIEPRVYCDICNKRIDPEHGGIVVFGNATLFEGYNVPMKLQFVHPRCEDRRTHCYWASLVDFFAQATNNTLGTKILPEELQERRNER